MTHGKHVTELLRNPPLDAWFLGPKAEHGRYLDETLQFVLADYVHWRRNYRPKDPVVIDRDRWHQHEQWQHGLSAHLDSLLADLKADVPFHSPRYLAHMLSDQTLPSIIGFLAGSLYNPNNVSNEAAPVTVRLELEAGDLVSKMLGYDADKSWAHLCSGGSSANLEALWVARTVQFNALAIWDACTDAGNHYFPICKGFEIPGFKPAPIRELDQSPSLKLKRRILGLNPEIAISLPRELAAWLAAHPSKQKRLAKEAASDPDRERAGNRHFANAATFVNKLLENSPYNAVRKGFHSAAAGLSPVILAPASHHYSLQKAANILGYGQDAVWPIPVDGKFRMDIKELDTKLAELEQKENSHKYVAAVVAVAGTTEEGAVDPIHKVLNLRREREKEGGTSFWLHVDAAWGGYFPSLFRDWGYGGLEGLSKTRDGRDQNSDLVKVYVNTMDVQETFEHPFKPSSPLPTAWDDPDVYHAFLALPEADSITVDPHKLGYVPYPAGLIAFRDSRITEHVHQKAVYIGAEGGGVSGHAYKKPTSLGPYILEGSKPGAAATSVWLAHQAIPLTRDGHGKIIRATAISAQRLYEYLQIWPWGNRKNPPAFKFITLTKPDTNVVCFVAAPSTPESKMSLKLMNAWNERIFKRLRPPEPEDKRPINEQEFFISHAKFEKDVYSAKSISATLARVGENLVAETMKAYETDGLSILRCTLMNPLHDIALAGNTRPREREHRIAPDEYEAERDTHETDRGEPAHLREGEKDYLKEFVDHLYKVGRDCHPKPRQGPAPRPPRRS